MRPTVLCPVRLQASEALSMNAPCLHFKAPALDVGLSMAASPPQQPLRFGRGSPQQSVSLGSLSLGCGLLPAIFKLRVSRLRARPSPTISKLRVRPSPGNL